MTDEPSVSTPTWADFAYDAVYSGAIGGSIVALFFLAVDGLMGRPLFTPSLMGSVLFRGEVAGEVTGVHLDMVALYSLVHFLAFGLMGCLVALAVREAERYARSPFGVLLGLFVFIEWAFFVASYVLLPGVMTVLGLTRVAVANFLCAAGIALFLSSQHHPATWRHLKEVLHIA